MDGRDQIEDLCPSGCRFARSTLPLWHATSEGPDRIRQRCGTYQIRVSAGPDPVTGRQLVLSGSAEAEDAAVLVSRPAARTVRDNTAARPWVEDTTRASYLLIDGTKPDRSTDTELWRRRIAAPSPSPSPINAAASPGSIGAAARMTTPHPGDDHPTSFPCPTHDISSNMLIWRQLGRKSSALYRRCSSRGC